MGNKLVIWGASGHALVIADIIRLRGEYELIGFIDDINPDRRGTSFSGLPVLGGKEQLDVLRRKGVDCIILGFGDCKARLKHSDIIRKMGYSLVKAIHPSAVVASDVLVGPGSVVVAGAVVNSGSRIGENVIINTCASVDHECVIEDGVHISPGVHIAGGVIVERGAWIGIAATVIDRVRIGSGAMIGAGAVVLRDIPAEVVAYGIPATVVESH